MKVRPTREIERQLQALRLRVRRVQFMRGGLLVGAVFLGGLLISMAADWIFAPLPGATRWAIFLLWMGALGWAGFVGFAPFFQKLSLIRIARWLESRHPELDERLSSALELSGQESASSELLESLVQAAEEDALLLDANSEVRAGKVTRQWRWAVTAAALILLLTVAVAPRVASRLIVRSVAPFSDLGNAGALQLILRPGDLEVMAGGAIEVRLDYSGTDTPEIVLDLASGTQVAQSFQKDEEGWIYRIEPARESFRYRARAGRALSDQYAATVHPQPRILAGVLKKNFPSYTELLAEEGEVAEGVEAVIGTEVELNGRLNTAVQSAWIELPSGQELPLNIENSSSEASVSGSIFMTGGLVGEAMLKSKHRLGNEVELVRFPLRALEDRAPDVSLLTPSQKELTVHPSDEIELGYEVKEDFGLDSVVLEVEAGESGREEGCALPPKIGGPRSETYRGAKTLSVAEMMERFQDANELRVRLRAEDRRPPSLQGPGRGFSEWLVIRVEQGAQSLAQQNLADEHHDARSTLEKAIRATREAEQKMQQNRHHLVKGERNEHSQKLTAETQEKLGEAEAELKELASRMEQGIHAAKTPEVAEAAEEIDRALQSFEEVALQDGRDERNQEMEEAFAHTREAIKQMEKIRNQIDQDKSKVDDLARLESLAQKQRELARQASKQAEEAPQESEFAQWRKQQKAMAEEVKSQLWNRPEAMAEVLGQQAEEARELAEKSRQVAAEQEALSELASAVEQGEDTQAENEQEVREQIKRAQQDLAQDISKASQDGERVDEAKNLLKEAAQEAREMAGEIAQKKDEQALQSGAQSEDTLRKASDLSEGDEASSDSDSSSSELAELADRQEALAQSAEALANDDFQKAAELLAESQQDRAERNAEKLQEMLEAEQDSIAEEAQKQLSQARNEMSPLANDLSEAVARAEQASEAFQKESLPSAAGESRQSAEALATTAAKAQELAKSEPSLEASLASEKLSNLAARQERVAEAAQALSEGQMKEALAQLQKLSQAEAFALKDEIQSIPQLQGSALGQAGHESQRGEQQAEQASQEAAQGQLEQASKQHGNAEQSFEKAASSLEKAAQQLAEQAEQAARKPARQHMAPTAAGEMAEAFQSSGQAAREESAAEAAQQASQAAKALAEAAQSSRQQMQGRSPSRPSAPDRGEQPSSGPGEEAADFPKVQEEQPGGVPPELAKLGINVEDWEKIQTSLKKDVGGEGDLDVPADYRGLVKDYFQTMSEQ